MSGIQTYTPTALEVTDRAVAKVQSLKAEEENEELKLRVFVTGGGCSGFQYTWGLSETKTDDEVIDNILLLDSLAIMYVIGSKIDYVTGDPRRNFKVIGGAAVRQEVENERMQREWCKGNPRGVGC